MNLADPAWALTVNPSVACVPGVTAESRPYLVARVSDVSDAPPPPSCEQGVFYVSRKRADFNMGGCTGEIGSKIGVHSSIMAHQSGSRVERGPVPLAASSFRQLGHLAPWFRDRSE